MNLRLFLPLLAAGIFSACTGGFGTGPGSGPNDINFDYLSRIGHWVNSYEEEGTDEVRIYRPENSREFPASRFRMQYIFRSDNTCDWFYLAPDDGHHFRPGTWIRDIQAKDVIHIDQGGEIVSYQILELTQDLLRMKPLP